MTEVWGNAIGVMITLIMLTFISIWIWAWRARHKKVFDKLSALPMEDPKEPYTNSSGQQHHDNEDS